MKIIVRKIVVCVFLVFFITSVLFSYPADVNPINNREYFDVVLDAINESSESIYMVMYYVHFNESKKNKVFRLVDALVNAHTRNVDVNVILDKNYDWHSGDDWSDDIKNEAAFNYLSSNGVNIFYDELGILTHSKYLVIDNKVVILGSTNWTGKALSRNNEASLFIRSHEVASEYVSFFNGIEVDSKKEDDQEYISISKDVVVDVFSDMVSRSDDFSYRIYMYLLKSGLQVRIGNDRETKDEIAAKAKLSRNDVIVLDYKELAGFLEIDERLKPHHQRNYIRRSLKKLQDRYKLIRYLNMENVKENPRVVLHKDEIATTARQSRNDRDNKDEIAARTKFARNDKAKQDESDFVWIPLKLWEYGWITRLSVTTQYCYFIGIIESNSQFRSFKVDQNTLAEKYNINLDTISKGMLKLRDWNLMLIKHERIYFDKRRPKNLINSYKCKELYDLFIFEDELEKLCKKNSEEVVLKAREYAYVISMGYDLYAIKNIVNMIDNYGNDNVKYAFDYVSKKDRNNPLRSMGYVKGILENRGKK